MAPTGFADWARSSTGRILRVAFGALGAILGAIFVVMALYVRQAGVVLSDLLDVPDVTGGSPARFVTLGIVVFATTITAAIRPNRWTATVGGATLLASMLGVAWLLSA